MPTPEPTATPRDRSGGPSRAAAAVAVLAALAAVVGHHLNHPSFTPALVLVSLAAAATAFSAHWNLRRFAFTVWVLVFVAASMFYPGAFMKWGGFDLGLLIVPLIQIIMFGMGTTLCVADFTRVFLTPWPVFIGVLLQFLIMPIVGFTLAHAFGFEGAIAAGVILVGCCPSGVASNVMAYLGHGDVALSVTVTSTTTLLSPALTPLLMQMLAGQFVQVPLLKMMLEIINMIVVPIVAGLLANRILYGRQPVFSRTAPLGALGAGGLILGTLLAFSVPATALSLGPASLKSGLVVGLLLLGVVALAKLLIRLLLQGPENWMDRALPILSMASICSIIAIITARSRNDLLDVGALLIASSMIHNALGYLLGYWCGRAARLEERACRTVAFEVGMQNGGMASALAMNVLKSAPAALASAIFGPWQNVSGSILATWWHRRPPVASTQRAPSHVPNRGEP